MGRPHGEGGVCAGGEAGGDGDARASDAEFVDAAASALGAKGDLGAIRRLGDVVIDSNVVGQAAQVRAIGVDEEDVAVAAPLCGEGELTARWVELGGWDDLARLTGTGQHTPQLLDHCGSQ